MPVAKSMHRRDDLSTPSNLSLRASHIRFLDALERSFAHAGIRVSRSRLVQYAVEQLRSDPRIHRLLDLEPLE